MEQGKTKHQASRNLLRKTWVMLYQTKAETTKQFSISGDFHCGNLPFCHQDTQNTVLETVNPNRPRSWMRSRETIYLNDNLIIFTEILNLICYTDIANFVMHLGSQ